MAVPSASLFRLTAAQIRTTITFALSFGASKATAFAAALALPRLVDPATYGVLELALTIGVFSASILGANVHAAAIRVYLVEKDPKAQAMLAGQALCLATAGLLAAALVGAAGYGADYVLCSAIIALFAIQFSLSTWTRMRGWIHLSGWSDNIALMAMTVLAAILMLFRTASLAAFAMAVAVIAVATAAAAALVLSGISVREYKTLTRKALQIGAPMTLYSFSALAMFATPRMAIAQALSISDVACYSLCARVALFLMFPNQLLGTGLFRQLYQMKSERVGRIMAGWIVALSLTALVFAVATRFAANLLVLGTAVPAASIVPILPAVIVQTVLWVLNANLEMFVNRELVSHKTSLVIGGLLAAALCVGLLLHAGGLLSLPAVIYVYIGLSVAAFVAQTLILTRKGFSFRLCYAALPLALSPLLVNLLRLS